MSLFAGWRAGALHRAAAAGGRVALTEATISEVGRREGPEVAGEFAARWVEPFPEGGDGAPTVLCLYRLQFAKDIAELRRRTTARWLPFKVGPLSAARFLGWVQKSWVPEPIRAQTDFMVAEGAEADRARELALRFGRAFLRGVKRRCRIDAVMSANVDYWQEFGILRACGEAGIPFLVLCREMAVQPIVFRGLVDYYRKKGFRFGGNGVALGARMQAEALVEAGVCREDQVAVTGLPRFDVWRDEALPAGGRRGVALVSFSDPRYGAAEEFRELLGMLAETSERAGEPGRCIVKCKDRADAEACRTILGPGREGKLAFEFERPAGEIYREAALVIGFNSTALVEALLSGACVAAPAWGGALTPPRGCLVDPSDPAARGVIRFPESAASARELMRSALAGEIAEAADGGMAARAFFRSFYHFPETGSCSAEVEAFARRWIAVRRPENRLD